MLLQLLRELPGYTRRELEAEPAWLIERWRRIWLMEARHAKQQGG